MLAILAAAALVCAASLIAGRALLVAFGRREWTWLSGPVGLAALVVVAQPLVRLPGRGTTAAVVLAMRWSPASRTCAAAGTGASLREVALEALPVALVRARRRRAALPAQRARRRARRGRLHQRPGGAALLGRVARRRLRTRAARASRSATRSGPQSLIAAIVGGHRDLARERRSTGCCSRSPCSPR